MSFLTPPNEFSSRNFTSLANVLSELNITGMSVMIAKFMSRKESFSDNLTVPSVPNVPTNKINESYSMAWPEDGAFDFSDELDGSLMTEIVFSAIIFGLAAPLNALTLLMQVRRLLSKDLSEQQRLLLKLGLQMTIANLIILFVCCLGRAIWLYNYLWYGGDTLCRLYSFGYALGQHLWSNLACAIAIDILICIRMPLKAHANTDLRSKCIIACVWVVSVMFSLPHMILRGTIHLGEHPTIGLFEQCYFLPQFHVIGTVYEVYNQATSFYIPLVLMTVCYSVAICTYLSNVTHQQTLQEGRESIPRRLKDDQSGLKHKLLRLFCCSRPTSRKLSATSIASSERNKSSTSDRTQRFNRRMLTVFNLKQLTASSKLSQSNPEITTKVSTTSSAPRPRKTTNRLITTAVVVVMTYLITWFPGQTFAMWRLACRKIGVITCDTASMHSWEWLEVFMFTCTITNPFVYKFLHTKRRSKSVSSVSKSTPHTTRQKMSAPSHSPIIREKNLKDGLPSPSFTPLSGRAERRLLEQATPPSSPSQRNNVRLFRRSPTPTTNGIDTVFTFEPQNKQEDGSINEPKETRLTFDEATAITV